MRLAWWLCATAWGMALQAVISAALFPDGIDPDQQLRAGVLFAGQAVFFAVLAVILSKRGSRDR